MRIKETRGTMGCLALLDSPDMSEEKGMAYVI